MKRAHLISFSSVVTLAILLAGFLLPRGTKAISTTWYVASTGADSNNCLTIATPCATLNGTLQKPGFTTGDTIKVASGVYTGTGNAVAGLSTSLQLLGGWNSDFTTQTDLSIIDGSNQRRGLEITNATVTLDHFVVQHGNALTSNTGGGILMTGSTVTVTESVIRQNVSSNNGAGIFQVGGVLTIRNSAVLDNIVGDNVNGNGGALYQDGGIANFTNATVTRNHAGLVVGPLD